MTQEEFKARLFNALIAEITPKLERLPHVKDGEVFKVIKQIKSIKIVDFVAPEFEIFTAHMLLDIRFKVALDFIYHTADSKKNNCDQQVSISKESFGTCRYISEQQWFKFEFERVVF